MVVLVVGGSAQVVAAVVGCVIDSEEIVGHLFIGACLIGVVHGTYQPHLCFSQQPAGSPVGTQLQVTVWVATLHTPVIAESIVQQVDGSTCGITLQLLADIVAAERSLFEQLEGRGVIPVASYGE